jgi:hypothetical protein
MERTDTNLVASLNPVPCSWFLTGTIPSLAHHARRSLAQKECQEGSSGAPCSPWSAVVGRSPDIRAQFTLMVVGVSQPVSNEYAPPLNTGVRRCLGNRSHHIRKHPLRE